MPASAVKKLKLTTSERQKLVEWLLVQYRAAVIAKEKAIYAKSKGGGTWADGMADYWTAAMKYLKQLLSQLGFKLDSIDEG